jgi:DNA-binding NarL/FixJ family response regulator
MEHRSERVRVLLADDHAVVREGLAALLGTQPDIEVVGAVGDGREAVRESRRLEPDVVVMDVTMPELNGIEAAGQIHDACPATSVVMLSMHSDVEHVYRALRAGARGYLLKSSAGSEVAEAVRAVISGRRYLSSKIAESVLDDYIRKRSTDSPLESLSPRERQILQLIAEGRATADIARMLSLSPKTVDTYRSRMMAKLGINDLPALIKFAVQHGLTPAE